MTDRGKVTRFVVQYETLIEERWTPIIRYDTAHGFAHCDEMFPSGNTKKTDLGMTDWGQALNFAKEDLNTNWEIYKKRYLRRVKKL